MKLSQFVQAIPNITLVYWGLTPQQQPGSYQGGEIMMKSVFWWRNPEYPEETTDLRQVTDETFHTYGLCPVQGLNLGPSVSQPRGRDPTWGRLAIFVGSRNFQPTF